MIIGKLRRNKRCLFANLTVSIFFQGLLYPIYGNKIDVQCANCWSIMTPITYMMRYLQQVRIVAGNKVLPQCVECAMYRYPVSRRFLAALREVASAANSKAMKTHNLDIYYPIKERSYLCWTDNETKRNTMQTNRTTAKLENCLACNIILSVNSNKHLIDLFDLKFKHLKYPRNECLYASGF